MEIIADELKTSDSDPGDRFQVVASVLAPEALAALVAERYRLVGPVHCHYIKRGCNDTYLVRNAGQRTILRAYPQGARTPDEITGEVAVLNALKDIGAAVSVPVADRDGKFVLSVSAPEGQRYLVLFTYAAGQVGDFDSAHLSGLGRALAELHEKSCRLKVRMNRATLDLRHLIWEPISQVSTLLAGSEALRRLQEIATMIDKVINGLPQSPPWYGLCHGDYGGHNSHVDSAGRFTHFDFDFCGYGWRAYDLAVFLWSRTHSCGRYKAQMHWAQFLNAYQQVSLLEPWELRAMPYFVMCREIWLMGYNERTGFRMPRRPGHEHLLKSVRFLEEWIEESQ